MSLWLVRAGKYGEHETRFIEDGRIYLTWEELTQSDMQGIADYDGIKQLVAQKYPGEPIRRIGNWSGQIWAFVLAMKPGDWVAVPRKSSGSIAIGEIQSGYTFNAGAEPMYRHARAINEFGKRLARHDGSRKSEFRLRPGTPTSRGTELERKKPDAWPGFFDFGRESAANRLGLTCHCSPPSRRC